MRYIYVSLILFLFSGLFCGCKEYSPQTTEEAAIEAALADGQQYFPEEFEEWKEWTVRIAEFREVELETRFHKQYDGTRYVWYVIIGKEDNSRSVHFVVTDEGKEVIGGWDSLAAVPEYKMYTDQRGLISVEDAIIRAIVFKEALGYEYGPWNRIEVRLDRFTESDSVFLIGYTRFAKYQIPAGQLTWKVTFCEHEKEAGKQRRILDCTVFVRASNGKVYGCTWSGQM